MIAKFVVTVVLILIIGSLGSALFYLLKDQGQTQRTARALTWRIGLSIGLFVCLIIAGQLGFIRPHGLAQGVSAAANPKR